MKRAAAKGATPVRECFHCLHYEACQSWNVGSLASTNAENCVNYRESAEIAAFINQPVGEWKLVGFDHGLKIVECSICNKRAYGSTCYCPNCGKRMKRGQNNVPDNG